MDKCRRGCQGMKRWKKVEYRAAAVMMTAALGLAMPAVRAGASEEVGGTGSAGEAAEDDGLLIEDFGEESVERSGTSLEEMKESERRESELAAEAAEAARAREEALAEAKLWLEAADPEILQQHLEVLTQVESPTGSDGELICGGYIEQVMEQYGFTISEQNFHEGFLNENGVDAPGINIIAERGADAQERTNEIFIIATHYDSKTNPEPDDLLANDKTGAAVLLEMARILSGVETESDICFVFFSGEEDGLYGSAKFVEFMQEDFAHRVAGVLYVEQVGYGDGAYLLKTQDGEENSVGRLVMESELSALLGQSAPGSTWIWTADQETGQYSFAAAGMEAVTVTQDVFGEYDISGPQAGEVLAAQGADAKDQGEIAQEQEVDVQTGQTDAEGPSGRENAVNIYKLADITDILADCLGQVMS